MRIDPTFFQLIEKYHQYHPRLFFLWFPCCCHFFRCYNHHCFLAARFSVDLSGLIIRQPTSQSPWCGRGILGWKSTTPPITNTEAKNCWLVIVLRCFFFSKGVFSGSMLVFWGVQVLFGSCFSTRNFLAEDPLSSIITSVDLKIRMFHQDASTKYHLIELQINGILSLMMR